jgi:phage shock protein C
MSSCLGKQDSPHEQSQGAGLSQPTPGVPPPPPPERPRLLRRSSTDKVIGGVCGGLGRYFGIDPVILRIAVVVLTVAGGGGILLYIIGWIAIPEEKPGEDVGRAAPSSGATARVVIGGTLIALGVLFLLDLTIPDITKYLWPLALVVVGIAIIIQASAGRR